MYKKYKATSNKANILINTKVYVPRPKIIQITDLEKAVPDLKNRVGDKHDAWEMITHNYCVPLYNQGICPMKCTECYAAMERMTNLEGARNWGALLIYQARVERGKMMDQSIVQKEERTYAPQSSGAGNVFANLFEDIMSQ